MMNNFYAKLKRYLQIQHFKSVTLIKVGSFII